MSDVAARKPGADDRREWAMPILAVAALVVLIFVFAQPGTIVLGAGGASALQLLIEAGFVPLMWMLGALGLGHWLVARMRVGQRASWSLSIAVGVGLMLWLAHVLGALGLLAGAPGTVIAWAPVAIGIGRLVVLLRASAPTTDVGAQVARLPATALLAIPSIAIMLVAACAPPGTLWRSEALGFDVLSYHLQLSREWLSMGRIVPLEHNVYSFLPSCVEAAYMQLASMSLGRDPVSGAGLATTSAAILHALLALSVAAITGRLVLTLAGLSGHASRAEGERAGGIGAAIVLLTPWTIVTGSLAYNEMPVLLTLAGAMTAAFMPGETRPIVRGALVGGLVGAACGAKLTAAYMVLPAATLVLLVTSRPRQWIALLLWASVAGLIVLAPWLVRNLIHSGQPVFPFLTSLLGDAHWSEMEIARWNAGHASDSGPLDRVGLLLGPRGLLHWQWALLAPAMLLIIPATIRMRRTRRYASILAAALGLQVVGWLLIGHQQSRFLLPALIPMALLVGVAVSTIPGITHPVRQAAARIAILVLLLATMIFGIVGFLRENQGAPNLGLVGGVSQLTGALAAESLRTAAPPERSEILAALPVPAFANVVLGMVDGDETPALYLLGESRPYYFLVPTVYHTTWDRSPLGALLREEQGDLSRAVARLRDELDVTHMLVNLDELDRLGRIDRWYDPDVDVEVGRRVIREHGILLRSWPGAPELGSHLIMLREDAPER